MEYLIYSKTFDINVLNDDHKKTFLNIFPAWESILYFKRPSEYEVKKWFEHIDFDIFDKNIFADFNQLLNYKGNKIKLDINLAGIGELLELKIKSNFIYGIDFLKIIYIDFSNVQIYNDLTNDSNKMNKIETLLKISLPPHFYKKIIKNNNIDHFEVINFLSNNKYTPIIITSIIAKYMLNIDRLKHGYTRLLDYYLL